jgi:3-oxoacyl-[acyl-carrier protein] reductase
MKRLQDRLALVTGAASGIGRTVCGLFAREGARVFCADLRPEGAEATARAIREEFGSPEETVAASGVDVSNGESVDRLFARVRQDWGALDILVNCAGIFEMGTVAEIDEAHWDRMLAVNLKGVFLCCRAALPLMRGRPGASIVNLASVSGRTKSFFAGPHYSASKAGVIGFTMTMAAQSAHLGVRVNAVAPGTIETPMTAVYEREQVDRIVGSTPMGRFGRAEEVAHAILFLASDEASFITGETLNVNGGSFMV